MGENMKKSLNLLTVAVVLALGPSAMAASFTPGNIVIYRVGGLANQTSGATLTNTGNIVWLDECLPISPTDVNNGSNLTVVQSIMLPTNYFGGYSPLIEDSATTLDGLISRSLDGRFLIMTGFGATLGQYTNAALTTFDADFEVPRIVGLVDGFGHIDTTTVQTNSYCDGEDIRSAATTDGTNLWYSGDTSGIRYTTRGSSLATQLNNVDTSNSPMTNIRQLNIFSNQLYFSTASGSDIRIGTAGAQPPPTTNGTLLASLPGVVTDTNSPRGFLLFNLAGQTNTFDTLYFADDGSAGNLAGIYKWSLLAGATNWTLTGSITASATQPRGLTGYSEISGGTTNVHLWMTNGGTTAGGSTIAPYVDSTGFNVDPVHNVDGGSADQYALAPSGNATANGYVFRGIAIAPVGGESFPSGPGRISVGPITDFYLAGAYIGGPFSYTKNYSVANPGISTVTWAVSATNNWVGLSPSSGTLTSGSSVTVAVSFNSNANNLVPGTNLTSIIFTNTTSGNNGFDTTTRPVTLILSQLAVTPSSNYVAIGPVGGPFTPSTEVYTLSNGDASASLTWGAGSVSNLVTLSATSGVIPAGATATLTMALTNAAVRALGRGEFVDTIIITNTAYPDPGDAAVDVSLVIGGGFTSNNLVIYRAGAGSATLNNQPTPAFVDEFTRSGVLVQSIPISTNNYGCSGTATAEGLMSRSTDKQFLVFVGYGTNSSYGSPAATSASTVVPRVVGRVDGNGNVDVTTRLTDFCNGSNPRAAVSTNGISIWVGGVSAAGMGGGVRYTTLGSTTSADVCTNAEGTGIWNWRALNIVSNQLYAASAAATGYRIGTVGTGLPTSDTEAISLPAYSTNEVSPYGFVMFKMQAGGTAPLDTLYVADDQGNNGAAPGTGLGAIYKWSLVSGNWVSNGYVNVNQVRGLAGNVSIVGTLTNAVLFAVGSGNGAASAGAGGTLTAYTDSSGWNMPPTGNGTSSGTVVLATAPINERWDSVSLAPEIPQTANLVIEPVGVGFTVVDMPSTVTTNSATYTVGDVSNSSMTWTATWSSTWLSLSTYGGNFAAGGDTNVTLSMNVNASALYNGTYTDNVLLVNTVNNQGNTAIPVSLTITGAPPPAGYAGWESYYSAGAGSVDRYGTGMSNTNKFLAGFAGNVPSAYLHIISTVKSSGNVNVTYLGASGDTNYLPGVQSRTNVLEYTTGTANGSYVNSSWTPTGQTNILGVGLTSDNSGGTGAGTKTNMTDIGGASPGTTSRYYRVRVLLP